MNKTILTVVLAALTATSFSASAISSSYRRQLEREHTTQTGTAPVKTQGTTAYKSATPAAKAIHIKKLGVDYKRGTDGIAYIDGKPAVVVEQNQFATVYGAGLHQVIVYNSGRISLQKEGRLVGYLK